MSGAVDGFMHTGDCSAFTAVATRQKNWKSVVTSYSKKIFGRPFCGHGVVTSLTIPTKQQQQQQQPWIIDQDSDFTQSPWVQFSLASM